MASWAAEEELLLELGLDLTPCGFGTVCVAICSAKSDGF